MTNLLATIFLTVTTNWTDIARITPVIAPEERFYAVYRQSSTVQRGWILTNTVARIKYEDREIDVVLKWVSNPTPIERTVSDVPITSQYVTLGTLGLPQASVLTNGLKVY